MDPTVDGHAAKDTHHTSDKSISKAPIQRKGVLLLQSITLLALSIQIYTEELLQLKKKKKKEVIYCCETTIPCLSHLELTGGFYYYVLPYKLLAEKTNEDK